MDFMDISKKRVTVRKFSQMPVEDEKIQKILEAGRWSPTAVNLQPLRILVLNTPESLTKVREFCSFGYDQKYVDLAKECDDKMQGKLNFYYGAPLVLFVCYDTTACWTHPQSGETSGATDATIVATHMMLEAWNLGIGSCWVNWIPYTKVKEAFAIPEEEELILIMPIGYPAEGSHPSKIHAESKALEELVRYL